MQLLQRRCSSYRTPSPTKIYCYNCGINIYEYELDTYEYMLRELKNHILLHDLPMVYFCNVGSIIRKNMLEARKLVSNEIILFVDDDFEDNKGIQLIPAGTFASIYFESFSFYKEKKYADILLEHIEQNNYKIVGDIYVKWWLNCPFSH